MATVMIATGAASKDLAYSSTNGDLRRRALRCASLTSASRAASCLVSFPLGADESFNRRPASARVAGVDERQCEDSLGSLVLQPQRWYKLLTSRADTS